MRIVCFKYGESVFAENYLFLGGDPAVQHPISFVFYLIETAERRMLVDVGCNDGAGFPMVRFCRPVEALAAYGLQPQDITDVILTHAHHDHVEAIADFPSAVIHIQSREYPAAMRYFPQGATVNTFEEELCPHERITVKTIGGHTTGSAIVLCHNETTTYVLCGDECYLRDNFIKRIPTGSSVNPAASAAFIETYGRAEYTPLLFHDPHSLPGRLGYEILT